MDFLICISQPTDLPKFFSVTTRMISNKDGEEKNKPANYK